MVSVDRPCHPQVVRSVRDEPVRAEPGTQYRPQNKSEDKDVPKRRPHNAVILFHLNDRRARFDGVRMVGIVNVSHGRVKGCSSAGATLSTFLCGRQAFDIVFDTLLRRGAHESALECKMKQIAQPQDYRDADNQQQEFCQCLGTHEGRQHYAHEF